MTSPLVLTTVEYLILDVLAARYGAGTDRWPFPHNTLPALTRLQQYGLVGWTPGTIEGTWVVWLTDTGIQFLFPSGFTGDPRDRSPGSPV